METKTFKKGEILSKEGSFELFMYVLISGRVGSYLEYGSSEERIIEINEGPGAIVGENGMFLSKPRHATFVALEDTVVTVITLDTISEYFSSKQARVIEIMQKMCEKNEHLSEVFGDACRAMSDYIKDSKVKEKQSIIYKINAFFSLKNKYNRNKHKFS